jgi:hypothetical protein
MIRKFFSRWTHDLPQPVNLVCILCGHRARTLLHQGQRKYCRCGNYMVREEVSGDQVPR